MPRKDTYDPPSARLSEYKIPAIDPKDRKLVEEHFLVRHALVDFEELAVLSGDTREQLVADLVRAICYARGGVEARKRHMSNKALAKHVFLLDVERALARANVSVKRWQKHDHGGGESLYYQMVHTLGEVFRLNLPKDLKPLAQQAARIQYGVMSPAMKAAQDAVLLAAARQRLDLLVLRLKAPLAAWRRRLGDLAVRLKATAP